MKKWFLLIVSLILLSSSASAFSIFRTKAPGNCAYKGYVQACECGEFDEKGTMSDKCFARGKAGSIACLTTTYPIMSGKYYAGECPTMDVCIQTLQACINVNCPGTDKEDCDA